MGETHGDEPGLIEAARSGELDAFNVLVGRYQNAVYNLCLRMLGPATAEDAAQEAFISAYRHLDRFRDGSFRAWLFRIASNACYDELRRRKSRPAASLDRPYGEDERTFDTADAAPSMEDLAANAELRQALAAALLRLPPEQRLTVVLCDVQGMDYAEIAVVTGASLGTVKSRLSRARSRLRSILLEQRELLPDNIRQTDESP
jgi:RNA polymerase sigma-70 factor (ECF subfamily)